MSPFMSGLQGRILALCRRMNVGSMMSTERDGFEA